MLEIASLKSELFGPHSLSLASGKCIAILGKSGSGKSLFLRAIADLDPNDGQILLAEKKRSAMQAWQWRREVMLVPAESGWWADEDGPHFKNSEIADKVIAALGLPSDIMSWQVSRLSTGERQRLALARAFALDSKVYLLDEPTAALDPDSAHLVETFLLKQKANGNSFILVTHDKEQAQRLAETVYFLANNKLTKLAKSIGKGGLK